MFIKPFLSETGSDSCDVVKKRISEKKYIYCSTMYITIVYENMSDAHKNASHIIKQTNNRLLQYVSLEVKL